MPVRERSRRLSMVRSAQGGANVKKLASTLKEIRKIIEKFWEEERGRPYKFQRLEALLRELQQKYGLEMYWEEKAISKHSNWFGWRRTRDGKLQLSLPHSKFGYVISIVFPEVRWRNIAGLL